MKRFGPLLHYLNVGDIAVIMRWATVQESKLVNGQGGLK